MIEEICEQRACLLDQEVVGKEYWTKYYSLVNDGLKGIIDNGYFAH